MWVTWYCSRWSRGSDFPSSLFNLQDPSSFSFSFFPFLFPSVLSSSLGPVPSRSALEEKLEFVLGRSYIWCQQSHGLAQPLHSSGSSRMWLMWRFREVLHFWLRGCVVALVIKKRMCGCLFPVQHNVTWNGLFFDLFVLFGSLSVLVFAYISSQNVIKQGCP